MSNYQVKSSDGRVPNDSYSIETIHGKYRAKRGFYILGNFDSHSDGCRAIVTDTQIYGATGITITEC